MCPGENRTCSKQDSVGLGQSSICKTLAVLGKQKQGNPQDSSLVESVSAKSSKRPQFTTELGRGRLPQLHVKVLNGVFHPAWTSVCPLPAKGHLSN